MLDTNAATIFVSTEDALAQAYETLSHAEHGGTIVVEATAAPLQIDLQGGGGGPVTITAAPAETPVTLTRIALREVANVTVQNFRVLSAGVGRRNYFQDVNIGSSDSVRIAGVTFESDASGYFDPADPEAVLGERMGTIWNSTNVTFENNTVSDYYHGLTIKHSAGVTVERNVFERMQGDGIRMSSVTDVDIRANTFQDFHGTVQTFNHNDMLQIWAVGNDTHSSNVTIDGNVFDAGVGQASQSIFIRNERWGAGVEDAQPHENIQITNNLIYNGHVHGIAVSGTRDLDVSHNTILWNEDAFVTARAGEDPKNDPPGIRVTAMEGVSVTDNIAGHYKFSGDVDARGNVEVDYADTASESHVARMFLNLPDGALGDLADLVRDPGSARLDAGSALTDPEPATESGLALRIRTTPDARDPQRITFDASASVDEDGLVEAGDGTFRWSFTDGTVLTGVQVTHAFCDPGDQDVTLTVVRGGAEVARMTHYFPVEDRDFLRLDFAAGTEDLTAHMTEIVFDGCDTVMTDTGRPAIHIQGDQSFGTTRAADQYHGLQNFGLAVELSVNGESAGKFLEFGKVMRGMVADDGTVTFRLSTDAGDFEVSSGDVSLHDGASHTVAAAYCSNFGALVLLIDGTIVGSVDAHGTTPQQGPHGVTIGGAWGGSVDAFVTGVYFGAAPGSVGAELALPQLSEPQFSAGDFLALDFDRGLQDGSPHETPIVYDGAEEVVTESGEIGIRIGGADVFHTTRFTDHYHDLDAFAFEIELAVTGESTGRFLQFGRVMWGWVNADGTIGFRLVTDEGRFKLTSGYVSIHDGETHRITAGYSAEAGQLVLAIDGVVVGTVEATGVTAPQGPHGLIIGGSWARAVDAVVESVHFGDDPARAGLLPADGDRAVSEDFEAAFDLGEPDLSAGMTEVMADYAAAHPEPSEPADQAGDPLQDTFDFAISELVDKEGDAPDGASDYGHSYEDLGGLA